MKLKKISDGFYWYENGNKVFTLKKGERGIYSAGECLRLRVTIGQANMLIACFTTKDDGHGCYKQDYKGRLWHNIDNILNECELLIDNMLD